MEHKEGVITESKVIFWEGGNNFTLYFLSVSKHPFNFLDQGWNYNQQTDILEILKPLI